MTISSTIAQQNEAFRGGINRSVKSRKEHLNRLKNLISEHEKALSDAVKKDFGKPYSEAYVTEIYTVLQEIDLHLKHLENWMKPKNTGSAIVTFPSKNYVIRQPYGAVLVISPWNYPIHLALMPVIGALSAGNTVVLKPSELSPNTSALLRKLLHQEFDPKLLSVFEGEADTVQELLKQPFDKIFFTGSTRVGKIVMKAAAEQLIPVTLELGGKSPAIVHKDANTDVAARRIWWGKTINAGQTCVAPDFVLVHESLAKSFTEESKKALDLFFKKGLKAGENYTQIVNKDHFDRLNNLLKNSEIILGGKSNRKTRIIEPTLIRADWDDEIMQDEIFGPLLPVITYSDEETIIRNLQKRPSPLALYLFTDDSHFQNSVIDHVPFGGGCINDTIVHLGNHNLPFGGVGQSGMGAYHGQYSFEAFSRPQSILKKPFWPDPDFRYPPYDETKMTWFKRLFTRN